MYQWKVIEWTKCIVLSCTRPGSQIGVFAPSCTLLFLSLMVLWTGKCCYLLKNWKSRIISPSPRKCRLKIKWLGAYNSWHHSLMAVYIVLYNSFAYSGPLHFIQPISKQKLGAVSPNCKLLSQAMHNSLQWRLTDWKSDIEEKHVSYSQIFLGVSGQLPHFLQTHKQEHHV